MAEHGGYRRPSSPAPVSGPGALSARTDGGPTQGQMVAPGGEYGARQEMESIQGGAPMMGGGGSTPTAAAPQIDRSSLVPFDAPTARPDEPVTAGADSYQEMGVSQIDDATRARLTNALPALLWLASQPQASEQTRQFVRQVRGDL